MRARATAKDVPDEIRLPIADISIGGRHRQSLGDLEALASSISNLGLLHAIVVTPERRLIAGERRLAAVRKLGWTDVPVRIVALDDMLRAEADENTVRLDFSPSEAVAIAEALREREESAAKGRMSEGGKGGQVATPSRSGDKLAAAVGLSRRTLDKARAVVLAAEADPEMGDLVATMDATGKVDAAFRDLARRQNRLAVAAAPVVTDHVAGQRYRCIVLDPPWDPADEGDVDPMGRANPTYATMPLAQIDALPVSEDAEVDAHIYLWATNRSLPKAFGLLRTWGFRYVTTLTWCKPSIGIGNYFRNNTEHVLFGVRGSLPLTVQDIGTWFEAPRGPDGHSSKPEAFYELVRRASPGPRAEWFGRREREGFVQRLPAIELP